MGNPKVVGIAVGLVIGVVLVWLGVWEAVVVGVLALAGWLIGKYAAGEIPIIDFLLERFLSSRNRE